MNQPSAKLRASKYRRVNMKGRNVFVWTAIGLGADCIPPQVHSLQSAPILFDC